MQALLSERVVTLNPIHLSQTGSLQARTPGRVGDLMIGQRAIFSPREARVCATGKLVL